MNRQYIIKISAHYYYLMLIFSPVFILFIAISSSILEAITSILFITFIFLIFKSISISTVFIDNGVLYYKKLFTKDFAEINEVKVVKLHNDHPIIGSDIPFRKSFKNIYNSYTFISKSKSIKVYIDNRYFDVKIKNVIDDFESYKELL